MLETQRMEPMIRRRRGDRGEEKDGSGGVEEEEEEEEEEEDVEGDDVKDDNIDWEEEEVRGGGFDEVTCCSMMGEGVICLLRSIFTEADTQVQLKVLMAWTELVTNYSFLASRERFVSDARL